MKIYEINAYVVQKVINKLIDGDYSLNVIKKNKHLIAQFFDYAIDNKWITENSILVVEWCLIDFRKHNLDKYNIYFYGLRHTFSNMLFEMNENPKVIQALLGHKSVKTTLTVYNSVDKSYYRQATDKLNNLFNSDKMKEYKELENKKDIPALNREIEEEIEEDDDEEIELLEKLLAQKRARKKNKDFEM